MRGQLFDLFFFLIIVIELNKLARDVLDSWIHR
jgi:hypothetical protein